MKKCLFVFFVLCLSAGVFAQEITYWNNGYIYKIEAAPEKGFNYPYLLMLPYDMPREGKKFLMVEGNNSGVSDDMALAEERTKRELGEQSRGYISDKLKTPFLMPVFPRPEAIRRIVYTHTLDRDAMLIETGPLVRLDLQLIAMIKDAKKRLKKMGIKTEGKILMQGFSASAQFALRFVALHPEMVQAAAYGGVGGLPTLPLGEVNGEKLIYGVGIYDVEEITGRKFNFKTYSKVRQYIYWGTEDENDALPYSEPYTKEEKEVIENVLGSAIPVRWAKSQEILNSLGINVQTHTYEGMGHRPMTGDVLEFFKVNLGKDFNKITPSVYEENK